jgi:hypothetical protein
MQSKGPQTRCDTLRLVRVLRPSEPDVLVAADERDAFGKSIRSFEEGFRYRFSDDGTLWTSGITLHRPSFTSRRRPAIGHRHPAIVCSILSARIRSEPRRIVCIVLRLPLLFS